jgi:hypothetical protein
MERQSALEDGSSLLDLRGVPERAVLVGEQAAEPDRLGREVAPAGGTRS